MRIRETANYVYNYAKRENNVKLIKAEDKEKFDADTKEKANKSEKDAAAIAKEMKKKALEEEEKRKAEEVMEQAEAQKMETKHVGAILTIFRRISRGDKVPAKDEKALMEYDMKLYMAAKNIAQLVKRKKIKKYKKSLIKELEDKVKEREKEKEKAEKAENAVWQEGAKRDDIPEEDIYEEEASTGTEISTSAGTVAAAATIGGNVDVSA